MSEMFNPHAPATAYDHNTTIVAVLELSGKNWLLGAVAPGLSRRMKRSFEARNVEAVVGALERAKEESAKAGFRVARIVVGFESGRDGFWIARALQQRGLEVYVMHAASIAVERRGKRTKTDRLDVDLLLTTLMGWLRGEPGRCTNSPVPSEEEEDLREAGRRPGNAGARAAQSGEPDRQPSHPARDRRLQAAAEERRDEALRTENVR